MKKIKEIASNAYEVAKNSNKTAKIISFFVGFFFNIIGVIAVAVWKLIFSKDEKKNKYCIRLSILGFITKLLIFSKICSFLLFSNIFPNDFGNKSKTIKHIYHRPVHISVFDDFGREFGRMHRRMNKMFEEQQRIFDDMFDESIEEQKIMEKEFDRLEKAKPQDVQVKKEVKNENGFETTTIEKTTPNSYSQHTTIKYVGDKNKNNKQEGKKDKTAKIDNKNKNKKR